MIEEADVALFRDFDKAPQADQHALIEEHAEAYAQAFVRALQNITNEDILQYILAVLSELIDSLQEPRNPFIKSLGTLGGFRALFAIYSRSPYNPFTLERAGFVLGRLYVESSKPSAEPEFDNVIALISNKLRAYDGNIEEFLVGISTLKQLLKNESIQIVFLKDNIIRILGELLKTDVSSHTQATYLTGFCLWLLSFNAYALHSIASEGIIERIAQVLKTVAKDKVARVYLAILRNLCNKEGFNELMINRGIPKVLGIVESKKFNDTDVKEDMEFLSHTLEASLSKLSTFEMYTKEVESGKLYWSQVHKEKFWRENVNRFEENDFSLVISLIKFLDSLDVETVAVACYDLGEFCRFYQGGKKILTRLKGKEKLMMQMSHPSPDVQKQALLAVQKLMVTNWSSLQK